MLFNENLSLENVHVVIDIDKYRVSKEATKRFLDTKPAEERIEHIGAASVSSGCPIIAVSYYYGEIYGFTPELLRKISDLCSFYKVSQVIGGVKRDL